MKSARAVFAVFASVICASYGVTEFYFGFIHKNFGSKSPPPPFRLDKESSLGLNKSCPSVGSCVCRLELGWLSELLYPLCDYIKTMRAFSVGSPKCRRDFFDCHPLMLMAYRMYGHPHHFDYLFHLLSL